jgi:DNA-binding transcriptional ArsR family regulator
LPRRPRSPKSREREDVRSEAERLEELDVVVSALAHATRRQILLVLHFRGGRMSAGEIADRFSCAWPTVSRHLAVLERAGLVVHEQRGRSRIYRLSPDKLAAVQEWLGWFDPKRRVAGR